MVLMENWVTQKLILDWVSWVSNFLLNYFFAIIVGTQKVFKKKIKSHSSSPQRTVLKDEKPKTSSTPNKSKDEKKEKKDPTKWVIME